MGFQGENEKKKHLPYDFEAYAYYAFAERQWW